MWGIIMTTENELIHKSFYQSMIEENNQEHPIKILGRMYMEEMQSERPDLSSIRFAQGEVYFLNHDYEAAIYKWQQPLEAPLIPWAQKNIADAHMEMGLYDDAERFYKAVESQSIHLKSEVLLQLFSLYKQQGRQERSVVTIKKAVSLNPDYPQVTEKAQTFFEDIKDFDSAIELALREGIRTESVSWFEILEGYARQGLTSHHEPSYFNEALATLRHIDPYRFENLTVALWNTYKQSGYYMQWIEVMNKLLLNEKTERTYIWKKLPTLFEETYFDLISGRFLIRDISNIIQSHLSNWLALSAASDTLKPSTAILAWKEIVPSETAATLASEVELNNVERSESNQNGREEGIELLESIKVWADKEGLLERYTTFMNPKLEAINLEVASLSDIRDLIKAAINFMLKQRVELENVILEDIHWNEERLTELQSIHDQLGDMEKEKASIMTQSFNQLKNKLNEDVQNHIPSLLQKCSDLVKEDSDFSNLHLTINEEMNKRIAVYLEENVLQDFKYHFQKWLKDCEREFKGSQTRCHELSRDINEHYQKEKLMLAGDFDVLGDWQRDIERISRLLLRHEKVNILLRHNPSQLLLKGAGKLFGNLSKNKDLLHSRYQNYIEHADYREVAGEIIQPFIQQLELFEESIEWDVNQFFTNPVEEINGLMEEVQADIETYNESLNRMRENPEIYRDPLTLFEVKLRQYELMNPTAMKTQNLS